jgi:hypothetical protein
MTTTNRPAEPYLDEATRPDSTGRPWWRTGVVAGAVLAAAILGLGAWIVYGLDETPGMATDDMAGDDMRADLMEAVPRIPPVFGYYDHEAVSFIHPEVSDPDIAETLAGMMGSPVPVVPELADVPDRALSTVYVFTNGVVPEDTPAGPLGFQPDVFDSAPGDDDYTPLRRIMFVTWADEAEARLLTSTDDIIDAEAAGDLVVDRSDVVVNSPLLSWPNGER